MPLAVELSDLGRRFGSIVALDGVTLSVPRGGVYGILGPNGAGKTTAIRILLGLLGPDTGTARTLGLDPRTQAMEVRRRVGVLLEHDGLYEPMSVAENLEYFARLHGVPSAGRPRRVRDVLEAFDLADRAREPAGALSKGLKRKLAIARALLHEPELVVLDEPTTGLDARAVAALREGLTRVVREHGVTLLLATHDLAEAERMCDRVAVLDRGRLVLEGPPRLLGLDGQPARAVLRGSWFSAKVVRAVRSAPGVSSAQTAADDPSALVLTLEPDARAAPAVAAAVAAGAQVEGVERTRASLEEAFLRATGRVDASGRWQEVEA